MVIGLAVVKACDDVDVDDDVASTSTRAILPERQLFGVSRSFLLSDVAPITIDMDLYCMVGNK
jgi:hypothetical protein